MDFTIKIYKELLETLLNAGFSFKTFEEYLKEKESFNERKIVVLRHDVDALPKNSLRFAQIQFEIGIHGTYYFRVVPQSWNEKIITTISTMGHEVGYHYENMNTVTSKFKAHFPTTTNEPDGQVQNQKNIMYSSGSNDEKLLSLAYEDFCNNLERLRKLVPINTICMHGSPRSKYDNKAIWGKYNYKNLGIIGEPYLDIDFDKVFYLTDTGRRWDGWKVSVRDKITQQAHGNPLGLNFRSTKDIIKVAKLGRLPHQIMITVHPQRWKDRFLPWAKELVLQNAKNIVKYIIINS